MPLVIVFIAVFLLAAVALEVVNWYRRPEPLAEGAVEHQGATEGFGKELHKLKDAPVSKELERVLTEAELLGRDWHQFHDNMVEPFNQFYAAYNAALDHFLRDMPTVRMEIA